MQSVEFITHTAAISTYSIAEEMEEEKEEDYFFPVTEKQLRKRT